MTGDRATTQRTDGARTVDDDRIDAVGWWQLVGLAVVGAVVPAVFLAMLRGPMPWTAAVVLGLALAVVLPASLVWNWSRRGGRAAVAATRQWVRDGSVPSDVPDAVWRPRVQRWLSDLGRRRLSGWLAVVVAVLWTLTALAGSVDNWGLALVWTLIAAVGLVGDRGGRAAAERLLAAPARA